MNDYIKTILFILFMCVIFYYPVTDSMEYRNNIKNDYIISTEDCIILECRRAVYMNPDRLLIECNNTKDIIKVPNMLDYYVGQHLTKTIWSYKPTEYK